MRTTLCFCAILLSAAALAQGETFVVAPGGNDGHPGTKEQPLATLEAARDAAREADGGPHRIVVMPGDYFLTKTLELDARDNGLAIEAAETGKATLYGGTPVTGWRRDGDKFWCADLPGVKEGEWDFRALVVNGRLAARSRMPEEGSFLHKNIWNVRVGIGVAAARPRKPTKEELTTLFYDPEDVPPGLDVRNAEVRVYHMWDDSSVPVARNDIARHALILGEDPRWPPGAFGRKKYVIYNTREGMTRPGQWYLDRTAGRLVYWPLPDEDMGEAEIVAPRLERVVSIIGTEEQPVENVTIRGLTLQATTSPLGGFRGFGASGSGFGAALRIEYARRCVLEKLEVSNVGGLGIQTVGTIEPSDTWRPPTLSKCRVVGCHVHHTGACGVMFAGSDLLVARNRIHHVGLQEPSAAVVYCRGYSEKGVHIYRNEIHDGPYCGIICAGEGNRIEENLVHRVMREMHDGAGIFCYARSTVVRGNLVRDIVPTAEGGYGAAAFYFDEGSRNCVLERNVSIGVAEPSRNHITRDGVSRDNVFIVDGDMQLKFLRSSGHTFESNTLYAPGKIDILSPNAITAWRNNVVYRGGQAEDGVPQPFAISDAMPPIPEPKRRTQSARASRVARPPTLDGVIAPNEWPGESLQLKREPSRWPGLGPPNYANLAYDDRFLYVAVDVYMWDTTPLGDGTEWGRDDGAEIAIGGKAPDGAPTTFVIRGYPGGAVQSVCDGGAPPADAARLASAIRFATGKWTQPRGLDVNRGAWRGEWAIPFDVLGLKPVAGLTVPFNLSTYRADDGLWRCWEGTQAETWELDQAGTLELK